MKDLETAARENCALAFEIAVKNCIEKVRGEKRRRVNISEKDSKELYDFYCKYVQNDREAALGQIALSSRRAASNGLTTGAVTFTMVLAFVFTLIFQNYWAPIFCVFACAAAFYPFWKRRRTAQKLWTSRRALKGGTRDALEKMCLVLAANPLRLVNFTVMGGLLAAAAVSLWELIKTIIK